MAVGVAHAMRFDVIINHNGVFPGASPSLPPTYVLPTMLCPTTTVVGVILLVCILICLSLLSWRLHNIRPELFLSSTEGCLV
ncbi:hypothetical protein OWV82_012388 [Melia azedarach]|uniref:Uncharacterized protein n=1 Tax=Melia azedarach TaxID=155640 RepID=A0ACC1Y3L4_MELAZ|nr:hypothetical protein OWV82_012388 [Melia azedarach]